MLNAEKLLIAEMEAAALNTVTSKSHQGSDSWVKYLVYGGIVFLTIAGAYYINEQYKKTRNEKSEE